MKRLASLMAALFLVLVVGSAFGAEGTWTGKISDSMCRAKHEPPSEGGPAMSERDCTLACVRGGSQYVLVTADKTFKLADQKDPALETYAGVVVQVTGQLEEDTIKVSKIEKKSP
jgi:hypothetical protein